MLLTQPLDLPFADLPTPTNRTPRMPTPPPAPDDNGAAWVLGCGLYVLGSVVINFAQVGCPFTTPCVVLDFDARAVLAT
jgi:hypothetical protein